MEMEQKRTLKTQEVALTEQKIMEVQMRMKMFQKMQIKNKVSRVVKDGKLRKGLMKWMERKNITEIIVQVMMVVKEKGVKVQIETGTRAPMKKMLWKKLVSAQGKGASAMSKTQIEDLVKTGIEIAGHRKGLQGLLVPIVKVKSSADRMKGVEAKGKVPEGHTVEARAQKRSGKEMVALGEKAQEQKLEMKKELKEVEARAQTEHPEREVQVGVQERTAEA